MILIEVLIMNPKILNQLGMFEDAYTKIETIDINTSWPWELELLIREIFLPLFVVGLNLEKL